MTTDHWIDLATELSDLQLKQDRMRRGITIPECSIYLGVVYMTTSKVYGSVDADLTYGHRSGQYG
jgi:hypothetical protein